MMLYVIKWDILPGMDEAYQEWAKKATEMSLNRNVLILSETGLSFIIR
jgi:hypothetical protein